MSSGAKPTRGTASAVAVWASACLLCLGCAGRLDLGENAGVGGDEGESHSELIRVIEDGVALAVDEERIYWIERGLAAEARVVSCAKNSCSSTIHYGQAAYDQPAFLLSVAGGQVYWRGQVDTGDSSRQGLYRCAAAGCGGSPQLLETSVLDLAVDVDAVYYIYDHVRTGRGMRRLVHGATVETATELSAPSGDWVQGLMAHGGDVYWISGSISPPQSIHTAPASGGPFRDLHHNLINPRSLASDGTSLYWASHALVGGISRCELPVCNLQFVISEPITAPNPLVLVGSDLYWGYEAGSTHALARFSSRSSSPEKILTRLRKSVPEVEGSPLRGAGQVREIVHSLASDGVAVYALTAPAGDVDPVTEIRRVWK